MSCAPGLLNCPSIFKAGGFADAVFLLFINGMQRDPSDVLSYFFFFNSAQLLSVLSVALQNEVKSSTGENVEMLLGFLARKTMLRAHVRSSVLYTPSSQEFQTVSMVVNLQQRQSNCEDNGHLFCIIKLYKRDGCGLADGDRSLVQIRERRKTLVAEQSGNMQIVCLNSLNNNKKNTQNREYSTGFISRYVNAVQIHCY